MNCRDVVRMRGAALLLVLLLCGCSDEVGPPQRAGSLGGIVWDADGARVEGARVRLEYLVEEGEGQAGAASAKTDTTRPPPIATLSQNFPNPYDESSSVQIDLEVDADVTLDMFDFVGNPVAVILEAERLAAGQHVVALPEVAASVYVLRLQVQLNGGTFTAVTHGVCRSTTNGDPTLSNGTTDAAGEFYLPLAEVACRVRVPLTGIGGPQSHGWVTIGDHVLVFVEHEGLELEKQVVLSDMNAVYYLEFSLPPDP
jgi:hypothetical protein